MRAPVSCFADWLPHNETPYLLNEGCPTETWEEVLAEALPPDPSDSAVTLVNVGANKGYKIPSFVSLWLPEQERVSPQQWHSAIVRFANELRANGTFGGGTLKWVSCGGGCQDCKTPAARSHQRSFAVAVHALELVPNNARLVETLANMTGLGHIVRVHRVAASNTTGTVRLEHTSSTSRFGMEDAAACKSSCRKDAMVIQQVTLDQLFDHAGIASARHVSIDTEGWDPLVLEGATRLLREKRAMTLSFEYIGRGFWRYPGRPSACHRKPGSVCIPVSERRSLAAVLARLEGFGWDCYIQASGGLVPASGPCWRSRFESIGWTNFVCAHDARVHAVLRSHRETAPTVERLVREHKGKHMDFNLKDISRANRKRIIDVWHRRAPTDEEAAF